MRWSSSRRCTASPRLPIISCSAIAPCSACCRSPSSGRSSKSPKLELSVEAFARRDDAGAQEAHVAAGGDEAKATFGERPCALAIVGIDAGDFPSLGRRLGDRGQRGVDLLGVRVDGFSVRERNRQVEWAYEDAVN